MRFGSNFLKYDDEAQNGTTCKNIKDDWIVTARGRPMRGWHSIEK